MRRRRAKLDGALEGALPSGNRAAQQVLAEHVSSQKTGVVAAFVEDMQQAAHVGRRIAAAMQEKGLNLDNRAAIDTAIASGGNGMGKDNEAYRFCAGLKPKEKISGSLGRRMKRAKKLRCSAQKAWTHPKQKVRKDSYWHGENGTQIHALLKEHWLRCATDSPLTRHSNCTEPGRRWPRCAAQPQPEIARNRRFARNKALVCACNRPAPPMGVL